MTGPNGPERPTTEAGRGLPRIDARVDTETLALIFMDRHIDRLSPLVSRRAFDVVTADLASWLAEWFDVAVREAAAQEPLDVERLTEAVRLELFYPAYQDPRAIPITFAHRIARTYAELSRAPAEDGHQ